MLPKYEEPMFFTFMHYKIISGPTGIQYDRILTSRVNYIFFDGKHFYKTTNGGDILEKKYL